MQGANVAIPAEGFFLVLAAELKLILGVSDLQFMYQGGSIDQHQALFCEVALQSLDL